MLTRRAFKYLFAMPAPAALTEVDDLTPGDFAAVAFGKYYLRGGDGVRVGFQPHENS